MELWLPITSLDGYSIPESELIFDQVHRGFYEIKDDMWLLCSLPSVLWTIISFLLAFIMICVRLAAYHDCSVESAHSSRGFAFRLRCVGLVSSSF
jgi:hypothetical protein